MKSTIVHPSPWTRILGVILLFYVCPPSFGKSQNAHGFYYPTDKELHGSGNWLATACDDYKVYDESGNLLQLFHIGEDIGGQPGDPVYAVTSGWIVYVGEDGIKVGNKIIWVRHTLANGDVFYALYGHVKPLRTMPDGYTKNPNEYPVSAGEPLARIAKYVGEGNDHLHFGVNPKRPVIDKVDGVGWGRGQLPRDWDCRSQDRSRLNDRARGFVDPFEFLSTHSPSSPPLTVSSAKPPAGATNISPQVEPTIEFNQELSVSDVELERLITVNPPLLAEAAGGAIPGKPTKELSADKKKILIRGAYFTPGVTYTIRVSENLKSAKGVYLKNPFDLTFTIAKQVLAGKDRDLSGRWEGEAVNQEDGTRFKDTVNLMQSESQIYEVQRRENLDSGDYIVTADNFSVAGFVGEHHGTGELQHVIEQRGSWVGSISCRTVVSEDGERIEMSSTYRNGTHQKTTWHRIARLKDFPPIKHIEHQFKGLVKLAEEIDAGRMTVTDASQYLLVFLNYPGSKLRLTAIAPDGKTRDANSPGVTYLADEIPARLYIRNPQKGEWAFKVTGEEVEGDAEPFWVLATYTDKGPHGESAGAGGGGSFGGGTDWQTALFIGTLVGIFILSALCVAVVMKRRGSTESCGAYYFGWLQVHEPGAQPRNFKITRPVVRIGQDARNDIILTDPQVSSFHVEVRLQSGVAILTDLQSTHGTWVNGSRVDRHSLRSQDCIQVGDTKLIYFRVRQF